MEQKTRLSNPHSYSMAMFRDDIRHVREELKSLTEAVAGLTKVVKDLQGEYENGYKVDADDIENWLRYEIQDTLKEIQREIRARNAPSSD